jgi:toxin secretion/phage lysis holin
MENIIKVVISAGGAVVSYLFGGWSALMGILLAFVALDYFSGLAAAWVEKSLSSQKGMVGIAKKVFIFAMVAVAHLIDTALGDAHLLRDATIFFYLANELLSIIENVGRIGLPVPTPIQKAVEVLKGKSGRND